MIKMNRIRIIFQYVVIVILYILINILTVTNIFSNEVTEISGTTYLPRDEYSFSKQIKKNNSYIEQPFALQDNNLKCIKIRLIANTEKSKEDIVLRFSLLDNDIVLHSEEVNLTEMGFSGWEYYDFQIPVELQKNKRYSVKIEQIGGSFKNNNTVYKVAARTILAYEHVEENEKYYIYNGKKMKGEWEVCYVYQYMDTNSFVLQIIYNIMFLSAVGCVAYIAKKYSDNQHFQKVIAGVISVITPAITFVLVEIITDNLQTVLPSYILKNVIIYYVLFILYSAFIHRVSILISVYTTSFVSVALLQYFVTMFRGRPFMLQDLFSVKTAVTVANSYKYYLNIKVFSCLLIYISMLIMVKFITYQIEIKRHLVMVFLVMMVVVVVSTHMYAHGRLFDAINMWSIEDNYKDMGLINTLMSEIPYLKVNKPEGYSKKKIQDFLSNVDDTEVLDSGPHNIILIMNETFSDLEYFNQIDTDAELLPFIRSMQDNTIKG